MSSLRFRIPGRLRPLGEWLARLLPRLSRADRRQLIEAGEVRVDGEIVSRGSEICPPGARVEIELPASIADDDEPEGGLDPAGAWDALVDRTPFVGGVLASATSTPMHFAVTGEEAGLLRIRIEGTAPIAARAVLGLLAEAGMPVAGDLSAGGLGLAGGPRLAAVDSEGLAPALAPVEEPAWRDGWEARGAREAGEPAGEAAARLVVSDQTARVLESGHPWIRPDPASDPATRFAPGTLVAVETRRGEPLGQALVEGEGPIAARIWARADASGRGPASLDARVARALALRRELLAPNGNRRTSAHRIVHGEGDDLPGVFVDRLGPLLRVLARGRASDGFREALVEALLRQLPVSPEGERWSVLEVLHLRAPGDAELDRVRWCVGDPDALRAAGARVDDGGLEVEERGLRFFVDPGWATPRRARPGFGLFLDQRENRRRLAEQAARCGGAWLNLFAHTGAFSVALLAGGAERVVSVDLSAPYLARIDRNLALNRDTGVEPERHEAVRADVRRFLEGLAPDRRFAGVVIDPPTAAAAGRRFWSVEQSIEPLLRESLARLEPGGTLLVTQNRAGAPLGLDRILERLARRSHRPLDALEPAPAGADHPSRPGFPEGDPFEGWLARLR